MTEIAFFTPVSWGLSKVYNPLSLSQSCLEKIDDYFFCIDGLKAEVQSEVTLGDSHRVKLVYMTTSCSETALKVASYLTLIIPVIMLIVKGILRAGYQFHVAQDRIPAKALVTSRLNPENDLHFSLEDIAFLATQCLGLRHVSSKEAAQKESQQGFPEGCSLGLSPQKAQFNLDGREDKNWLEISHEERPEFIKRFEEGVDQFIDDSLTFDALRTPVGDLGALVELNKTPYKNIAYLVHSTCFSLVKYQHQGIVEQKYWGNGLGRFPKQSLEGKAITLLPYVDVSDLGYTQEELQAVLKEEDEVTQLYKRLTSCYRSSIIRGLRDMQARAKSEVRRENSQFSEVVFF